MSWTEFILVFQKSLKKFLNLLVGAMWAAMLGFTALPHVGGICGGFITRKEIKTWYTSLNKPSWRPPNSAFPVVWTALYTGMGLVHQHQFIYLTVKFLNIAFNVI